MALHAIPLVGHVRLGQVVVREAACVVVAQRVGRRVVVVGVARRVVGLGLVVAAPVVVFLGRVDQVTGALAQHAAGDAADGRTGRHADRTADRAHCRARRSAAGHADAAGQVMLAQVVALLRVHHFGRALAGHVAGDAADRGAGDGADRTRGRTDARADGCAAQGADAGADHVATAVLGERTLDVLDVLVRARGHAHHDAALVDAFFVVLDAFFRNAGADQCTDQAAGDAARAGACQRGGQRTGD